MRTQGTGLKATVTEQLTQEPTGDRLRPWRSVKRVFTTVGGASLGVGKVASLSPSKASRRRSLMKPLRTRSWMRRMR